MDAPFTWASLPARVILAPGAVERVPGEVERAGGHRVLLIGSGASTDDARRLLRDRLGRMVVSEIPASLPHVPVASVAAAVTTARAAEADILVTVGGGSATGLGKAVALDCRLPLIAVPTTYSGSEMTPMWGRTAGGVKETGIDPAVQPRVVVYDPELCTSMPAPLAAASGMNALAHCVEALWSPGRNPITDLLASEGIRRLARGLPLVVSSPRDVEAHASTLVAACLAGMALTQAGTGIHHRTCHVLGGGWGLPHAETHAVVLPHATALVAQRAGPAVRHLAALLETDDAAGALFAMGRDLGLPASLASLGLTRTELAEATRRVAAASRDDPLVPGADAVGDMLDDAFAGLAPRRIRARQSD